MDEDDGLRFLFAKAFENGQPTDDCPSADVLLEAYHQTLPVEQRREVVAHLAMCSVCAEAWRLARSTPAGAPGRRD